MTALETIAEKIIEEQARIIGPVAWSEAKKVHGLTIEGPHVTIENVNGPEIINMLVKQYERLFGPASREVCRDAVVHLIDEIPKNDVPSSLRIV